MEWITEIAFGTNKTQPPTTEQLATEQLACRIASCTYICTSDWAAANFSCSCTQNKGTSRKNYDDYFQLSPIVGKWCGGSLIPNMVASTWRRVRERPQRRIAAAKVTDQLLWKENDALLGDRRVEGYSYWHSCMQHSGSNRSSGWTRLPWRRQMCKMWWLLTCVTCQFLKIEEVVNEGMLKENVHKW